MNLKGIAQAIIYTKGNSDVVTGVKQKDAGRIIPMGAIGGCGTYRIPTPASLELLVKMNNNLVKDNNLTSIDVKNLLKDELGFAKFSAQRIEKLRNNLPKYELEFIKKDDNTYHIDKNGENVKLWIEELKKLFNVKWYVVQNIQPIRHSKWVLLIFSWLYMF